MARLSQNIRTILGPEHEIYTGGTRDYPEAGWNDITSSMGSGRIKGNGDEPDWVAWKDGLYAFRFNNAELNEIWISFHILHDYMENSPIYPHIHWATGDTTTGTVRWGIEFSIGRRDYNFADNVTIYLEDTVSSGSSYVHRVIEATDAQAETITAVEPDTLIQCRIFRDATHANDTFEGSVYGLTADLHYRVNKINTINKAAPFNG